MVDTKKPDCNQWLEVRKGGIGSSDAAAAVGLCPYKSHLELWIDWQVGRSAMLKAIGGVIVYGFAVFGLGVYLQRVHARHKEKPRQ